MTHKIFKIKTKKRITQFYLSNDWNTTVPWSHRNVEQPYFSCKKELSKSNEVDFTYLYLGPLGIISGKWIGE